MFKADEWDDDEYVWHEKHPRTGCRRPVIIHRAILGSVERFMAICIEHLGGKWPFWVSPRQAIVVPISDKSLEYCEKVYLYLHHAGYKVDIDRSNGTIKKKVRNAEIAQYNYILVAGEEESKKGTIDIRDHKDGRIGNKRIDEVVQFFKDQDPENSNQYK